MTIKQTSADISDKVTLLVFKDNYSARTFQIPLKWISRAGALLGILVALMVVSTLMAIKYYSIVATVDPSKIQELEQEVSDLKSSLKAAEAGSHPNAPNAMNFPEASTLPFSISTPTLSWVNSRLQVQFTFQYTKDDQGSQQGKFLILARGPESVVSYPSGTLSATPLNSLVAVEKGESFSVSRFREVKIDLGPIVSPRGLQDLEIYIFDNLGKPLSYQKIAIPAHPSENESSRS